MGMSSLIVAAVLPVAASAAVYAADKKSGWQEKHKVLRQVIIGVVFGVLSILGTEMGVLVNGAVANVRDAAPICAGLFFGGPAGIIAGLIGGIERWIAVAWGVGTYTRVACTVSTIIAGFFAAFLRKYMFEKRLPSWAMALATGVVLEVFHLMMVFVTNLNDASHAIVVVQACCAPLLILNCASITLSAVLLAIVSKRGLSLEHKNLHLSTTMQRMLLVFVSAAFVISSLFMYSIQTGVMNHTVENTFSGAISDVIQDVDDACNEQLVLLAYDISAQSKYYNLSLLAQSNGVDEINVIDSEGIIVKSTNPSFVGYDMASGEQSAAFLCLLDDEIEYVQEYGPISYDSTTERKYVGVKLDDGFVQVGLNAGKFQSLIKEQIGNCTTNRHIGESGILMVIDSRLRVISGPREYIGGSVDETPLLDSMDAHGEGQVFTTELGGMSCMCMYKEAEGYRIIAVEPSEEVLRNRSLVMYVSDFLEVLIFAVMFLVVFFIIKRHVVAKMDSVNETLDKITHGNLSESVEVRSNAEFSTLSDGINTMVGALKGYIKEAEERYNKELEMAKSIQTSSLPNVFPAFPNRLDRMDIYARMDTAKDVGGDFYDFYFSGKSKLNFVIADVSGKGIPAALFMMRAKTQFKSLTETGAPLNEVFAEGNNRLCEGNEAGMFVTAWQAQVDIFKGEMSFVNAGHNPPLIKKADGKFEYFRTKAGLVLAGMEDFPYKKQELTLDHGDIIFLYTDGITEANDIDGNLYGEDRLINYLNGRTFDSLKDICDGVKEDVDRFAGEAPQFDDMTMLAFVYK